MASFNIKSIGITDIGKRRRKNEDAFVINDALRLYVVADGMGGHAGGEFASKFAATAIHDVVRSTHESGVLRYTYFKEPDKMSPSDVLRAAVIHAGNQIMAESQESPALKGMGTTLTACMITDEWKALVAHVGDSRLYHVHDHTITQITQDHSVVAEQVRLGNLTPEEAKQHQMKNVITRSLGVQADTPIDMYTISLQSGDTLILCSDGVHNSTSDDDFLNAFTQNPTIESAASEVILHAVTADGDDNATCIAVRIESTPS